MTIGLSSGLVFGGYSIYPGRPGQTLHCKGPLIYQYGDQSGEKKFGSKEANPYISIIQRCRFIFYRFRIVKVPTFTGLERLFFANNRADQNV